MLSSSVVHIIDLIRLYQKTRQVKGKKFNTEIACAYVNLAIEKHGSKLIFGGACDLFVGLAWLLYKGAQTHTSPNRRPTRLVQNFDIVLVYNCVYPRPFTT